MTDTAYQRIVAAFRQDGLNVRELGPGKASAQGPGHSGGDHSVLITDQGGRARVYSFAGEEDEQILAAVGLGVADLFDNPRGPRYKYPDGRQVHRSVDKRFHQSGNTKGASLYRVEFPPGPVFVVEGEADVHAVEAAGGAATCSAMGAGKAGKFNWAPLQGREVVIVADRDKPGRRHAAQVAEILADVAASVSIVEAANGKDVSDHLAAHLPLDQLVPVDLTEAQVPGDDLLDSVRAAVDKYVRFTDEHAAVAVTLWAVHTWAASAFYVTPRLVLDSPEPGSGKTRVLEILALLCHKAKLTLSTTTPALYRRIAAAEDRPPTVLQDEADAIFGRTSNPQAEDLRALFNAGYKRGATVDRCEGDAKNMKVREFPVFAPVALAGLAGKMPATITSRAVTIHMRRRGPGETVASFRERDAREEIEPIRVHLETWAEQNLERLAAHRPDMPSGVEDRPAEVWEALLAVADVAGGEWPKLARAACERFVLDTDNADVASLGVRLLTDVRKVFGARMAMHSADLVADLVDGDESEWADLWGKPLDQRRLAKELKRYGVHSNQITIGAKGAKGYRVDGEDGLLQAWQRYLPNAPTCERNKRNKRIHAGQTVSLSFAVSDVSETATPSDAPVSDVSETAKLSETAKQVSDQHKRARVSEVSEVSDACGVCGQKLLTDESKASGICYRRDDAHDAARDAA